jgi:glycosyltransferase involved in cell wall biosynthesis
MPVSVLIPVYNKAFAIDRVLKALMQQVNGDDEVVVLDDGSEDDSAAIIKKYDVKLITRERTNNLFRIASGRNLLVREASNENLIFLSGDCIPRDGFVKKYKKALASIRSNTVIRGMVKPGQPIEEGYSNKWNRLITGNIGLTKRDFNHIGCMDENYDGCWGHEDIDFGYRAVKIHGYNVYCIQAWVDHVDHPRREQRGLKNQRYFRCKHRLRDYIDMTPKPSPAVSVLIPVYNKEFAIKNVLGSLLPQLDKNDEVIVLNDGSSDKSREIISSF